MTNIKGAFHKRGLVKTIGISAVALLMLISCVGIKEQSVNQGQSGSLDALSSRFVRSANVARASKLNEELDISESFSVPPRTTRENQIWCVPGCSLDVKLNGEPKVPGWCTAWVENPGAVCAENTDGSRGCVSAKDENESKPQYVCQRIDLEKLKASAQIIDHSVSYLEFSEDKKTQFSASRPAYGIDKCTCALPFERFGQSQTNGRSLTPDWCLTLFDGFADRGHSFSSLAGVSTIENPIAYCKQILSFYGDQNVE